MFCRDCADWRFETNPQLQNPSEQEGFGLCERIEDMMTNPQRALARIDEEYAHFECRGEYGCSLFQAK